ncbi:MAG: VWA domain-containing protein [Bacteroidales bacterium]|nr:VWA domain-containing protein [Bacteroidales bacterium]MDE6801149.1 VWA domain-containing protein [Muribaculaceae bacterium]
MEFAHPHYLYLLLLVPAILGLFYWARLRRRAKLRKFGRPEVLEPLMPDASKYTPWVKIILELIAVTALVIAVARPLSGEKEHSESTQGIEVMIALDVSKSMNASSTDEAKSVSRLDRAKFLLRQMVKSLDNDRVGLIVFAGESYVQLPITSDMISTQMYIDNITTDMVTTQGTVIGNAIGRAMKSFSGAEDVNRAIVIITDGENHEGNAVDMAREALNAGIEVDVIGVGSIKGSPIPVGKSGEYLKDYNGAVVTTALNEEMAREIAQAGGGIYIQGSSKTAVKQLTDQLDHLQKSELKNVKYKSSAEQFPVFGWIALAFLIVDIFVLDRKIGWLKKYTFFSK